MQRPSHFVPLDPRPGVLGNEANLWAGQECWVFLGKAGPGVRALFLTIFAGHHTRHVSPVPADGRCEPGEAARELQERPARGRDGLV